MSGVFSVQLPPPPVREREIFRYLRAEPDPQLLSLVRQTADELLPLLEYKACACRLPLEKTGDGVRFGPVFTRSKDLTKALSGCEEILAFAATVGLAPDRLMARYTHTSPAKALCVQAIATERIEALCDSYTEGLSAELAAQGLRLCPRFSPGYGDLALDVQRELFALLDCQRKIGLFLGARLLMSPTKSVTALAGIQKTES